MVGLNTKNRSYQPIGSYGVIGDCHSAVLIAPDGSVDWACLPDFDSPAIFCRLLDARRGGFFQIAPTDNTIPGVQRYLRDSNVLQTRFTSIGGEIVLTDFMPVESLEAWPYRGLNNNTWSYEDGSCHSLVRIVECTHGELPITVTLKATPNYAATTSQIELLPNATGAVISDGQQHIGLAIIGAYRLPGFSLEIVPDEGEEPEKLHPTLVVQVTLREGERLIFAIGMGRSLRAARKLVEQELLQRDFTAELAHTLHCWRRWISGINYDGPYAEWVRRSALVLKMMTYAPTGALVAAPTTSLPEEIGGVRNWDYRFTWLRDASFTLYALLVLGFTDEARAFTYWLRRLSYSNGEDLQVMYGIRGERELPEQELPHLEGYCGSRPVRIGNAAADQKQMDVFGEILDCIHLYRRRGGFERYGEKLEGPLWEMLRSLVDYVCAHWHEPDRGIWEMRGEPRHYVYSKVMCWVALDRGIRAAEQLHLEADLLRWYRVRDQIRADVLAHGYNTEIGAFTQSYASTALDASNLLLPLIGFIPADDPRMRSTVDRIMEQLTDEHGFVYRYLSEDGLPGHEGTFTICTCWLIDNLAMQGRLGEARSLFERLLTYGGNLGLFSEEIDSHTRMALGNYPQAFTHIALINSAYNLYKAEQRLAERDRCTQPVIAAIQLQKKTDE
ncbi:glucoamylase [Thermogemmatispora aurantia]|uniref:Trehalase n=1 Tax=Thermogemmatispora aurantia TaxID=2045279 RepID=A0A5J4K5Y9_9CHLR|nr:glycoside hydrolase family 15 protein [Thermogemmatispora aurantia]GER82923.1 glucoamylase [Thermogemmatispora aurantia]